MRKLSQNKLSKGLQKPSIHQVEAEYKSRTAPLLVQQVCWFFF